MKLLIITAIEEYADDIKKLLKQAKVVTYSFKKVIGFRDDTLDSIENNWFGVEVNENDAILVYAFLNEEKVDTFFDLVEEKNKSLETKSRIHVASVNIEKLN